MFEITVITPTIGRFTLKRLVQSLVKQNVSVTHLIMWDKKRELNGYCPYDLMFSEFENENYKCFHYVIEHPVKINRKDNYLRTVGLMMSNTEFITQIDDDCWLEENWLNNAIYRMNIKNLNYCFCSRQIWEDENIVLGVDTYESIGIINKFGYNLIETNSLVFRKNILDKICSITYLNNDYGHDRELARYLVYNETGMHYKNIGLHQIVPDFTLEDHKRAIRESQND